MARVLSDNDFIERAFGHVMLTFAIAPVLDISVRADGLKDNGFLRLAQRQDE
jgi:hypothetical protein